MTSTEKYQRLDVEDVIAKLKLSDKVALLSGTDNWHTYAVPSLRIPPVRVSDGPNGIRGITFFNGTKSNCFPCATGLAASFNVELIERVGVQMAEECRAKGAHVWLGPTLNVQRSPLGGRGFESYSEDPLLSGRMAAAIVRGVQSQGVTASPKHFVCNEQERDRMSSSSELSDRALREIYLKAFQVLIKEGQPGALMTGYNKVNGTHCSESEYLLKTILRDEWGFDGMIMSDWFGTYSTAEALRAGLDLEMPGPSMLRGTPLLRYLAGNKIRESELTPRLKKILGVVNTAIASKIEFYKKEEAVDNEQSRKLLLEAAREAVVLIKNHDNVLPLPIKKHQKIAVIGSNAQFANISGGGSASMKPTYAVTPLQGVKQVAADSEMDVTYEPGVQTHLYQPLLDPWVEGAFHIDFFLTDPAANKTVQPVWSLDYDTSIALMGDGLPRDIVPRRCYVRMNCTMIPDHTGLWEFGLSVAGKGDLYINDEKVIDNSEKQTPGELFFNTATVEEKAKIQLEKGRAYRLRLEWRNVHLGAESDFGGYRIGAAPVLEVEPSIQNAVDLAKRSDAVIVIVGTNAEYECEGYDRKTLALPPHVDEMVDRVLKANDNSIVVVQSGMQCLMPWSQQAKGIVQAFFGGCELGTALADIIFGVVSPTAKLPLTFPLRIEDVPSHPHFPGKNNRVIYNEDVFVGYRNAESTVPRQPILACFGHGLSYTTFELDKPSLDAIIDPKAQSVQIAIDVGVSNTGHRSGSEVIQAYVQAPESRLPRPRLVLASFSKLALHAGQTKTAVLSFDRDICSYWDEMAECDGRLGAWVVEAGKYAVHIGTSVRDLPHIVTFVIERGFMWRGM